MALYLHVPFCHSICPYCDFVVIAGRAARGPSNRVGLFVEAVAMELDLRAEALDVRWGPPGTRPPLRSVYLGGGTPSLLPAEAVAWLLDLVRSRYGLAPDAEVTIEANPGPAERGDLAGFVKAGVNRLSVGAQSFDPGELRTLGRRHGPADVAAAVRQARDAGIASISLDLLYDVPRQTIRSWRASLDTAIALEPEHLSAYALTLDDPEAEGLATPSGDHLPLRPGARRWRAGARVAQDEDRAAAMYELADARLAAAGFAWYEISNWSRPGHQSRHNLAYWRRLPYEAVGPGAHAFDGLERRWNAAGLDGYLGALLPPTGAPALPPGGSEMVGGWIADVERLFLGLRTADGLPARAAAGGPFDVALAWAAEHGLLEERSSRLRLTVRGRLLSNELFAHLVT